jgi:hypothetical protein
MSFSEYVRIIPTNFYKTFIAKQCLKQNFRTPTSLIPLAASVLFLLSSFEPIMESRMYLEIFCVCLFTRYRLSVEYLVVSTESIVGGAQRIFSFSWLSTVSDSFIGSFEQLLLDSADDPLFIIPGWCCYRLLAPFVIFPRPTSKCLRLVRWSRGAACRHAKVQYYPLPYLIQKMN